MFCDICNGVFGHICDISYSAEISQSSQKTPLHMKRDLWKRTCTLTHTHSNTCAYAPKSSWDESHMNETRHRLIHMWLRHHCYIHMWVSLIVIVSFICEYDTSSSHSYVNDEWVIVSVIREWSSLWAVIDMCMNETCHMCDMNHSYVTRLTHTKFVSYWHVYTWVISHMEIWRAGACQNTTKRWKTRQHTATHYNTLQHTLNKQDAAQHTATHCNTLWTKQDAATHCNTQHTVTHCNTLQYISCNNIWRTWAPW